MAVSRNHYRFQSLSFLLQTNNEISILKKFVKYKKLSKIRQNAHLKNCYVLVELARENWRESTRTEQVIMSTKKVILG